MNTCSQSWKCGTAFRSLYTSCLTDAVIFSVCLCEFSACVVFLYTYYQCVLSAPHSCLFTYLVVQTDSAPCSVSVLYCFFHSAFCSHFFVVVLIVASKMPPTLHTHTHTKSQPPVSMQGLVRECAEGTGID